MSGCPENSVIIRNISKDNKKWVYGGYELMDENTNTIHRSTLRFIPYTDGSSKKSSR
jgi:hypothetical protein